MSKLRHHISISADGFVAGPNQSEENPLGEGERLHDWMVPLAAWCESHDKQGGEGWTGWWGDNPPYHYPVFIVTHHRREPVEMEGGTTYHFVTDGIESALEQAREAAGGQDVMLWGGAQVIQQYLAAGLLDELELHIVPCCSWTALASSTTSGAPGSSLSRPGRSRRPASRTSSTGC